jgi:hypothetical protein
METWAGEGKREEVSWDGLGKRRKRPTAEPLGRTLRENMFQPKSHFRNRKTFSIFESFPNLQTKMNSN